MHQALAQIKKRGKKNILSAPLKSVSFKQIKTFRKDNPERGTTSTGDTKTDKSFNKACLLIDKQKSSVNILGKVLQS